MQTKYLCVHIRNKGEVGAFNMLDPSSIFFTDHSKAVLHLWNPFYSGSHVSLAYCFFFSLHP